MKKSLPYLTVIAFAFLSLLFTLDYENELEKLQEELDATECIVDSMTFKIDSLLLEIDTLTWKNEIWDYNIENNTTHLLSAIMFVESSFNDSAYNPREDAVGCLQIRQTMVNDVNRILKRQGKTKRYNYTDRWCRSKSVEMFDIFCKYYKLNTAEQMARCWNGGPRGIDNPATLGYWEKVQDELDS
jgi:hypothetical protein